MYQPDRTFMRDLKRLDSRLGVKFNGSQFVITYERGYGEPVNVHVVKGDDGGFRQPDRRDFEFVCSGDLARESIKEKLDRTSREVERIREQVRKRGREMFRDRTKDDKIFLKRALGDAFNLGKCNSEYRRINIKPKGKVF